MERTPRGAPPPGCAGGARTREPPGHGARGRGEGRGLGAQQRRGRGLQTRAGGGSAARACLPAHVAGRFGRNVVALRCGAERRARGAARDGWGTRRASSEGLSGCSSRATGHTVPTGLPRGQTLSRSPEAFPPREVPAAKRCLLSTQARLALFLSFSFPEQSRLLVSTWRLRLAAGCRGQHAAPWQRGGLESPCVVCFHVLRPPRVPASRCVSATLGCL